LGVPLLAVTVTLKLSKLSPPYTTEGVSANVVVVETGAVTVTDPVTLFADE